MHHYYHNPKNLDLAKIRDECYKRQQGDSYADPAPSIIHFHSHDESCHSEKGEPEKLHEIYQVD